MSVNKNVTPNDIFLISQFLMKIVYIMVMINMTKILTDMILMMMNEIDGVNFWSMQILSLKKDNLTISERVCSSCDQVASVGSLEHCKSCKVRA